LTRQDIHYAWIMLARCFLGLLTAQGVRLSFGAFMEPWEREFAIDRGAIAQVSLLSFAVYGVMQPIVGRLVDHYRVRRVLSLSVLLVGLGILTASFARSTSQLLVLYGLVASIGFGGASSVTASVAVAKWFQVRRGLAFAIIEAGLGAYRHDSDTSVCRLGQGHIS
jgi:MFS family permease